MTGETGFERGGSFDRLIGGIAGRREGVLEGDMNNGEVVAEGEDGVDTAGDRTSRSWR